MKERIKPAREAMVPLLTLRQTAEKLNVNEVTLRRLIDGGKFPVLKVGHLIRVRQEDIDYFLKTGVTIEHVEAVENIVHKKE